MEVTRCVKRRHDEEQAASLTVEVIELRNPYIRMADRVRFLESNIGWHVREALFNILGVRERGMF
jgi:hypothetical protein